MSQGATSNPHILEERKVNNVEDSGVNEEEKYVAQLTLSLMATLLTAFRYGAVVRGSNAYIPPGARKTLSPLSPATPASGGASAKGREVPKVSINAPDGSSVPQSDTSTPASSSKAPSPTPPSQKVIPSSLKLPLLIVNIIRSTAPRRCTPRIPRIRDAREAAVDSEASGISQEREG